MPNDIRAETRGLTAALNRYAGDVLKTFYDGVTPHFEKHNRLTLPEIQAIADDLDKKARAAFSPLWCDMELLLQEPRRSILSVSVMRGPDRENAAERQGHRQ